jgi:hypothetical protein
MFHRFCYVFYQNDFALRVLHLVPLVERPSFFLAARAKKVWNCGTVEQKMTFPLRIIYLACSITFFCSTLFHKNDVFDILWDSFAISPLGETLFSGLA